MQLDIENFAEMGLDPQTMGGVIERVLFVLEGFNSREAEFLANSLEGLRDDCEMVDA
jgi:hypothetical protein